MPARKFQSKEADDDFVSFAALHTKVSDEKKLRKAPRPAYTYWDYDPRPRPLVTPAQSRLRDADIVSGLSSRLNRLSSVLSTPSTIDRKWRRKAAKSQGQSTLSTADSTTKPTRWHSLSDIDAKPSKVSPVEDDVTISSNRLGTKMEELRNLLTLTARRPIAVPGAQAQYTAHPQRVGSQRMSESSVAGSKVYQLWNGSGRPPLDYGASSGGRVDDWMLNEPNALYTSSFSVDNEPAIHKPEQSVKNAGSISTNDKRRTSSKKGATSDRDIIEEKRQTFDKDTQNGDRSDLIHGVLKRLRNPSFDPPPNKYNQLTDDGSRAELAIFAAQIGDLSLPAHMERGAGEDFWVRMGHSRAELTQLNQLVQHTFNRSRRDHHLDEYDSEQMTAELELFPTAALAKRWVQDRLNST